MYISKPQRAVYLQSLHCLRTSYFFVFTTIAFCIMPTLIQELHSLERLTLRWAGAIDHQDPRFGCLSTIAMITVELRNSEGVRPIGEPFSRTVAHFENCQYTPNLTEMDMLWIMLVCSYDVKTSPSFSFDILPPKFRLLEDTLFQKLNTAFGEFFFHFFQLKVALYKLQESSQTHIIFYRAACFLDKCCCLPLQSTWLSIAVCNALRINITQILLESPFRSVASCTRLYCLTDARRHQPTIPSNDTSSRPTQRLIAHTETPQTTVVEVDASNVEVSDHLVTDCRSEERHCSEHYAESPIAEDSPIAVHPKNTGHQIPRKRKASPRFVQPVFESNIGIY